MDTSILLSIVFFVVGSVAYTTISYAAKYMKDTETKFNMLYIFTALLSMFLVILLAPAFLLPGILPFAVSGASGLAYIIIASFCMGLAANFFINLPLSFLLKQLAGANVLSLTSVNPKPKYILYLVATLGLIFLICSASVYAVIQYETSIHTTGTIETQGQIRIFSDQNLSNEMVTINWGLRQPGSEKSVEMWIQNTGSEAVSLSFYTSTWVPSAADDYMNVYWDYDGSALASGNVVKVTLTLAVSAQVSGITNFSFDITIVAS